MAKTKIEWTDYSWNPIVGCSEISEGCMHCYAKRMCKRFGWPWKPTFHPDRLEEPLRWKKPSRIFVCSMGDLFHEDVQDGWIRDVFWEIQRKGWHTFMVLTKRPKRTLRFMEGAPVLDNLWLGVSVENQRTADERIPILLQIPAAKRFVSCEPLLSEIDLGKLSDPNIGWVICGGLSLPGGKIQAPKKEWVDSLVQQCDSAGVPIFIKPNAKYPIERKEFPE